MAEIMRKITDCSWILLLFVYGCARVPPHEKATPSQSTNCDKSVSEALQSGDFKTGQWPRQAWWEDFEDPVLTHLIQSALALSPTLKRAEDRMKAAHQVSRQKKAAFFPEIDLSGDNKWQHLAKDGFFRAFAPTIPPVVNDITLGLSFFYEFDLWGKNRDLYRAAMGQAQAAAAERMQAELILTTSIAYTYAELQFLLRKKHIYQQMERNTREIEEIRVKRQQHALDNSLMQLRSHFDTLDIQAMIKALEKQILLDIHQLKALSGLGQDVDLEISYHPLNPLAVSIPENLPLDLIARRPDLIGQKARLEAAAHDISAAKTDFYPNISLSGLVGYESVFGSKLFNRHNYSGTADPAIHLPIFTAGRLRAQLMEKVAVFNEAVHAYDELILKTAQEVADRLTDISLLQRQIEIRRLSFETTQQEVAVTQQRVEHALDDKTTLLDTQNVALESELTLADVDYGKQLAAILLIRALGGGFHE